MNVYDFDKTIYINDCSVDFIKYLIKKKPYLLLSWGPKALVASTKYFILKKGSKEDAKEVLFSILKYFNNREELIKDFWDKHEDGIKEFYLKQKQDDDLIISASPLFLIEEICQRLNIKCFASPLDLNSLKYKGKNCYGEEKVIVYKNYTNENIDKFYSDSYSDDPLAKIAKEAYLVKGNKLISWQKEK